MNIEFAIGEPSASNKEQGILKLRLPRRFAPRNDEHRVTSCGLRCGLRVAGYGAGYELRVAGYELRVAGCELRVVGCGRRPRGWWGSLRHFDEAQCKQAQDKFFVFSLTIATILYKYMRIYLWIALRIVVFERGLCGGDFFIFSHRLRVASYGLRVGGCKLRVTSYELWGAGGGRVVGGGAFDTSTSSV